MLAKPIKKKVLILVLVILGVLILAGAGIYYFKYRGGVEASTDCPNTATLTGSAYYMNPDASGVPLREIFANAIVTAYVADCNGTAAGGGQMTVSTRSNYNGEFKLTVPVGTLKVQYTITATGTKNNCKYSGRTYESVGPGVTADASLELVKGICSTPTPTATRTPTPRPSTTTTSCKKESVGCSVWSECCSQTCSGGYCITRF